MDVLTKIIRHFAKPDDGPGQTRFATALGYSIARVGNWTTRGIPLAEVPHIIATCTRHGLRLRHSDFFEDHRNRAPAYAAD